MNRRVLACVLAAVLVAWAVMPAVAAAAPAVKPTAIATGSGSFYYEPWGGDTAVRFTLREFYNDPCIGPVAVRMDGEWWTGVMNKSEGNFIDENNVVVIAEVFSPDGVSSTWVAFTCYDNGPGAADRIVISPPDSYDWTEVWLDHGQIRVRDFLK